MLDWSGTVIVRAGLARGEMLFRAGDTVLGTNRVSFPHEARYGSVYGSEESPTRSQTM